MCKLEASGPINLVFMPWMPLITELGYPRFCFHVDPVCAVIQPRSFIGIGTLVRHPCYLGDWGPRESRYQPPAARCLSSSPSSTCSLSFETAIRPITRLFQNFTSTVVLVKLQTSCISNRFKMPDNRTILGPLTETWTFPSRCNQFYLPDCSSCTVASQGQKCNTADPTTVSLSLPTQIPLD